MAIIFYWKDTGKIYGVHPDLKSAPDLPAGIAHIEIAGTPDKIAWPIPAGQTRGCEHWSVVDIKAASPALIANPSLIIEPDADAELEKAIVSAMTLDDLKNALLGKLLRKGKIKGKPI